MTGPSIEAIWSAFYVFTTWSSFKKKTNKEEFRI